MAYESKVFFVNVIRGKNGFTCAQKIAEVELSAMGYENGWRNLFTKEIDYKIFMDDGETEFDTDMYGDHLKSCSVDTMLAWVEKEMERSGYNWRLPTLRGLLKGLLESGWKSLDVVHFGH